MKNRKELNAPEEEAEILSQVIAELSEEKLARVSGGGNIDENALVTFTGKLLSDGSHNMMTNLTSTVLYNQTLEVNESANSVLPTLKNRNGESLNLKETDEIHISSVFNLMKWFN